MGVSMEMGYVENVEACADACGGISKMFSYGTDKHGNPHFCREGKCKCECERTCDYHWNHKGFYLYKFRQGEKSNFFD